MKLKQNTKYTTIAIYTILVFAACLVIYKFTFTWDATMIFLKSILHVIAPFLSALLLAYFTSPMLNFFESKILDRVTIKGHRMKSVRLKRTLSIIMSYLVILGTIAVLISFVVPQVVESVKEISTTIDKLPKLVEDFMKWLETRRFAMGTNVYHLDFLIIDEYLDDYLPTTLDQFTETFKNWVPNIINFTASLATWLVNIFLGFVIAVYLLFNKESYTSSGRKVFAAILPIDRIDSFFETAKESHRIFTSFFIGKLIDSLIIGLLCFFAMIIFKIPYSVLISVIVGVTNMIPYFGPFIGGGIGILFLLIGSPIKALAFAIIVIVLQQFDGNILGPKILGDSTGLKPFWVIFAIMTFGSMFGLMGMFVGVPCFAVIKNIFDNTIDRRYRDRMALRKKEAAEADNNYTI